MDSKIVKSLLVNALDLAYDKKSKNHICHSILRSKSTSHSDSVNDDWISKDLDFYQGDASSEKTVCIDVDHQVPEVDKPYSPKTVHLNTSYGWRETLKMCETNLYEMKNPYGTPDSNYEFDDSPPSVLKNARNCASENDYLALQHYEEVENSHLNEALKLMVAPSLQPSVILNHTNDEYLAEKSDSQSSSDKENSLLSEDLNDNGALQLHDTETGIFDIELVTKENLGENATESQVKEPSVISCSFQCPSSHVHLDDGEKSKSKIIQNQAVHAEEQVRQFQLPDQCLLPDDALVPDVDNALGMEDSNVCNLPQKSNVTRPVALTVMTAKEETSDAVEPDITRNIRQSIISSNYLSATQPPLTSHHIISLERVLSLDVHTYSEVNPDSIPGIEGNTSTITEIMVEHDHIALKSASPSEKPYLSEVIERSDMCMSEKSSSQIAGEKSPAYVIAADLHVASQTCVIQNEILDQSLSQIIDCSQASVKREVSQEYIQLLSPTTGYFRKVIEKKGRHKPEYDKGEGSPELFLDHSDRAVIVQDIYKHNTNLNIMLNYTSELMENNNTTRLMETANTNQFVEVVNANSQMEDVYYKDFFKNVNNEFVGIVNTKEVMETFNTNELIDTVKTNELMKTINTMEMYDANELMENINTNELVDIVNTKELRETINTNEVVESDKTNTLMDTVAGDSAVQQIENNSITAQQFFNNLGLIPNIGHGSPVKDLNDNGMKCNDFLYQTSQLSGLGLSDVPCYHMKSNDVDGTLLAYIDEAFEAFNNSAGSSDEANVKINSRDSKQDNHLSSCSNVSTVESVIELGQHWVHEALSNICDPFSVNTAKSVESLTNVLDSQSHSPKLPLFDFDRDSYSNIDMVTGSQVSCLNGTSSKCSGDLMTHQQSPLIDLLEPCDLSAVTYSEYNINLHWKQNVESSCLDSQEQGSPVDSCHNVTSCMHNDENKACDNLDHDESKNFEMNEILYARPSNSSIICSKKVDKYAQTQQSLFFTNDMLTQTNISGPVVPVEDCIEDVNCKYSFSLGQLGDVPVTKSLLLKRSVEALNHGTSAKIKRQKIVSECIIDKIDRSEASCSKRLYSVAEPLSETRMCNVPVAKEQDAMDNSDEVALYTNSMKCVLPEHLNTDRNESDNYSMADEKFNTRKGFDEHSSAFNWCLHHNPIMIQRDENTEESEQVVPSNCRQLPLRIGLSKKAKPKTSLHLVP